VLQLLSPSLEHKVCWQNYVPLTEFLCAVPAMCAASVRYCRMLHLLGYRDCFSRVVPASSTTAVPELTHLQCHEFSPTTGPGPWASWHHLRHLRIQVSRQVHNLYRIQFSVFCISIGLRESSNSSFCRRMSSFICHIVLLQYIFSMI